LIFSTQQNFKNNNNNNNNNNKSITRKGNLTQEEAIGPIMTALHLHKIK